MKKIFIFSLFMLHLCFGGQDTYGSQPSDTDPASNPAESSKTPMLDFFNSLDWDIFFDKFKIEIEPCICDNSTSNINGVEIPLGFKASLIEPIMGISSSNQPGDLVGLNIDLGKDLFDKEGTSREGSSGSGETTVFRQINFVTFPFMAMVGFVLPEAICFDKTTEITSSYMSDVDPLYQNDILSLAVNTGKSWGRVFLINPLADLACVADCAASTAGYPINSLYWCDGCRGNIGGTDTGYTKTGDPIENSEMIIFRQVAAMHETSRLLKTSNASFTFLPNENISKGKNEDKSQNKSKGKKKSLELPNTMCKDKIFPLIIKDQYYLQLAYGKAKPFGAMRFHYDFKSSPTDKDRFFFWLWRVRDYCFGQTHCQ
ncbi:hypothetical protein BKH42_03675 [Helicobacter sp. 13S00482-2]|uniref:TraU family protein n=1 Tax=Helicobacter sp. 13S00482-2 TaxID=1476200 RepID=UPI000BA4ED68|nr:TraU family protein [Helicobacter sp. 13S00482-2]PAF53841.1 hypothetical protein BKH42_03675 [Helicobacter sp. 13S00482-2]